MAKGLHSSPPPPSAFGECGGCADFAWRPAPWHRAVKICKGRLGGGGVGRGRGLRKRLKRLKQIEARI